MTSTTDSQICANPCPKATGGEPCAHCPLVAPVEVRDAKTQAVLDGLEQSIAKTDELTTARLDQSANRADVFVAAAFMAGMLIAVMAILGSGS